MAGDEVDGESKGQIVPLNSILNSTENADTVSFVLLDLTLDSVWGLNCSNTRVETGIPIQNLLQRSRKRSKCLGV